MADKMESVPFMDDTESRSSTSTLRLDTRKPIRWQDSQIRVSSLISHVVVVIFTSLVWGGVLIYHQHGRPPVRPFNLGAGQTIFKGMRYLSCGGSLDEALENDCVYDMLANHYVPRICQDDASIKEYKTEGTTWQPYIDMNWTERLPSDDAMGPSGVYWTNQRDHIVHCAMLWRKQWRALTENRRFMDFTTVDRGHMMHCSQFLMDMTEPNGGADWRETPISVEVGYSGCVDMSTFTGERNPLA